MRARDLALRLLTALLLPAAISAAAALGWLDPADGVVSDALYQRHPSRDVLITIVGMDQRAVEALGPMPWSRDVMARAIAYLDADPETAPAVIGIDVLYAGASGDPAADARLAEEAGRLDNVVVAAAATIGPELVDDEEPFYMDPDAVLAWDPPYPALAEAASYGHINAMQDEDGILRHAMLYVDTGTEGQVLSFSRTIYELWCARTGQTPLPPPDVSGRYGYWYVPDLALPGDYYDRVSIVDLLDGSKDPSFFTGRIVLIGPYTMGMLDEYPTSVDHAQNMYGIEFHANQIDAFRRGVFPREVDRTTQVLLLFALCALAQAFFYDRKIRGVLPVWLALSLGWIAVCWIVYGQAHLILHVLWTPLAVTVLFIVSVTANYVRAQRERHRVTATFGRYVDPAVLRELLEQGDAAAQLGGTMRQIAVLFVDIRGFTTMSEALDPPTVVEIIDQYLTLTTECIMRRHGTLDKFVGDCTMAFWNAPLPQEDPVYLACQAAMDMVEGSKALGEELQERFGRTVSFGIGVHYGPAVVGNIGAPMRMDYTAIGDTVNTASRLESNAPGGKILISRAVADALGDRARTTSLGGSVRLKGKAEGFEVLTLDGLDGMDG